MSSPCDTPCETFIVCKTGLGTLPPLPTRFGGGALAPASIPVILGGGASGAAGAACNARAVPPLTTRGSAAGLVAAAALPAELEDFVELGVEIVTSSAAASASSTAGLATGATGCELGEATTAVGVAG